MASNMNGQFIFSPGGGDVRNFLKQYIPRSWWKRFRLPLDPDDYRWVWPTLRTELLAGTTSGTDSYEVPNNHAGIIMQIRGHLAIEDFSGEQTAISAVGNPDVVGRMLVKAQNCRIQLENSDRSESIFGGGNMVGGGGRNLALSTILTSVGGEAMDLSRAPHPIKWGEQIELTATLNDTATDVVGAQTEYGVTMGIILVRVKG